MIVYSDTIHKVAFKLDKTVKLQKYVFIHFYLTTVYLERKQVALMYVLYSLSKLGYSSNKQTSILTNKIRPVPLLYIYTQMKDMLLQN